MGYLIRTIINGICMSLADSVPGVSGGTVAFIMGFYDKFIKSTNDIFYGRGEDRKNAIFYLIKIGIGWAIGMIASVLILTAVFEKYIYVVSSLFFGFIIASIPLLIKEEKKSFRVSGPNIICLIIGIGGVVAITIISKMSFVSGINFGLSYLNPGLIVYIFIGGILSTSAMFLPGLSGSTILLVLGIYIPVMKAGRQLLSANMDVFPGLLIFLGGIIVGALSIVKLIQMALDRFRSQTMFLIMGLMIGSLFSIVMGPTTLENPMTHLTIWSFNWVSFGIGVGLIGLLALAGRKKEEELEMKKIKNKKADVSGEKNAESSISESVQQDTDSVLSEDSDSAWEVRRGRNKNRRDRRR